MVGDGLREAAEALIADVVLNDLSDRSGVGDELSMIDAETMAEIRQSIGSKALTALLALLDQRGFAVVPKVATEDAQDNGREEILSSAIIEHEDEGPFIFIGTNAMQAIYAALLAAAPDVWK